MPLPTHQATGATQPASPSKRSDASLSWWPTTGDLRTVEQSLREQPGLALGLVLLTVISVGMELGGIALFLWAMWTGRIRSLWRGAAHRVAPWSFGELGRVLLLGALVASLLPFVRVAILSYQMTWNLDTHLWTTVSMLFLDSFVIVAILAFAAGKARTAWAALGVSVPRARAAVTAGVRGYVAMFPWIFLLLFLVVELARRMGWQLPLEPIHELIFEERRPLVLGLTVLLACVVGPVAEELLFRGVFYAALRRRTSRIIAMVVSGTVFSLVHTNLVGFLPIAALGCLLAYVYEQTGSLISSMTVHILHNSFLMAMALAFRQLMMSA